MMLNDKIYKDRKEWIVKVEIIVGKTAGFCYGVKNAVDGAIDEAKNETAEDINPQYDEIVENSNIKSQILNPTDYNVFEDQGNGVGAPEETRRYNFNDDDDDDFDPKPKKRGKHF